MADKLHDPLRDSPAHKHPEPYQHELNPHAGEGGNFAKGHGHPAGQRPRTAYDVKEAHRLLSDFHDDELRRIPILPAGMRLDAGATYIDLRDPSRREFTGEVSTIIDPECLIVPKAGIDYPLWNRLIGVTDPARIDAATPAPSQGQ
jgi:hypothetical protein